MGHITKTVRVTSPIRRELRPRAHIDKSSAVSGVASNLLMGGQAGDLEGGTPQRGSAAEPQWGSGGEVPRNWRQMYM